MAMATFQICKKVKDVYISHKKHKSNKNPFGFVHFQNKREATGAIARLDGMDIKECKIGVIEVSFVKHILKSV